MKGSKFVNGVHVMPGSKAFELLSSNKPEDQKAAQRLMTFCAKAEKCGYDYEIIKKLREEYKDVV